LEPVIEPLSMNTVEKLTAALGPPRALRMIASGRHLVAAVGRWRHQGAQVDLGGTGTVQLVFNVSGGQRVSLRGGGGEFHGTIRAGSLGVVSPDHATRVAVTGGADTVQIIVSRALIDRMAGGLASPVPARFEVGEPRLQAAAAQALVALARSPRESRVPVDGLVGQVARCFGQPATTLRPVPVRGGLSPSARRRVWALMDERLRADGCLPLALGELASAAGLSVHHFVKAFHQTEGRTPYASVLARRVDLALALLLQPKARVDWIAEQTGFSSPAHFVSAFRQRLGVTPGALHDAAAE
jgi:AraC family transcriptional regulator